MLSREVIIFNTLSLVVSLGLCAAVFSAAAISPEKQQAAQRAMPVETFPDVDLGVDYGEVSVAELMGYYIENPPLEEKNKAPEKQHFGGC